jgi:hypothetical protein
MRGRHIVTTEELREALQPMLRQALARLAPAGGDRSITVNLYCDFLVSSIAEMLANAPIDANVDTLTGTFRQKLTAALGRRTHSMQ